MRYQHKEIESARIKVGEEASLVSERNVLKNSETVTKAIKGTSVLLMGTSKPGVYDRLIMASENVELIANVIPDGEEIASELRALSESVEEINSRLLKYLPRNTEDPTTLLDRIENRLDVISKIKAKYGDSEESVLSRFDEISKQISFFEQYEFSLKELEETEQEKRRQCEKCAKALSDARRAAARIMSESINAEFEFLDMGGVLFEVQFTELNTLEEIGDTLPEFFVKTNPGEPYKKLSAIASGGELSRIMLALMKILAGCDNIGTIVFDEIDTGVSGKTSSKIGISIKSLSKAHQVICVTHSAQVSAVAHNHYKISKRESDGRMQTEVTVLSESERISEIARILGGVTVTDHAIETAKELILQGKNI